MSILLSDNTTYHADRKYLSSSMLKLLLRDAEGFYNEFFGPKKAEQEQEKDAFTEGSFVHTLLLEPDKVISDYAMFPGLRRQGRAWEDFKAGNPGKTILTAAQVSRCEALAKSATSLPIALELLSEGLAEHTMTSTILDTAVKARADYINVSKGYIVDVKTTSMPTGTDIFKLTVQDYMYQLSAALYCQIAYDTYGKLFDFYFVVLSKHDKLCSVYKASSQTLVEGSALVTQAIVQYKLRMQSGNWSNELASGTLSTGGYEIEEV